VTADKVIVWDGKKAFEIVLLLATAVVMTAAVFDVVPSTDIHAPAVEQQAGPGPYGATGVKPEQMQPRAEEMAAPQEETANRAQSSRAVEKTAPVR